jgi:putative SOS response-associated peptidase YedK
MCGRLTITHPTEAMARLFGAALANDLPQGPNYNLCPTQSVAVVTGGAARHLRPMRWGFIPAWYKSATDGPLIINARAETVAIKPAFREAIRMRRCILPASGFYEWSAGPDKTRLPWYITRRDGAPFAFAALWQSWGDIDTFAVVTTEAGADMAHIHDREPVILEAGDWPLWLGEAGHGAAPLMRASAGVIQSHRVGVEVNSNRASGAHLIDPIPA